MCIRDRSMDLDRSPSSASRAWRSVLAYGMLLCNALYCDMQCSVLRYGMVLPGRGGSSYRDRGISYALCCYARCDTELPYAATRCVVLK
eukprot:2790711-Rhodomonas_salina.1